MLTDHWSDFKTHESIVQRVDELWDAVDWLLEHSTAGQFEDSLEDLSLGHRRWIVQEIKIVYRSIGPILLVTDFFDSRQDPSRMKG